jgi:hypothetical protein
MIIHGVKSIFMHTIFRRIFMIQCPVTTPTLASPTIHGQGSVKGLPEEAFSISKHMGSGWIKAVNPENMLTGSINATPSRANIFPVKYTKDGEERLLEILKSRKMLLTLEDFMFFWLNKKDIPKKWKQGYITFDGTTFQNVRGEKFVLCLRYDGKEFWTYKFKSLSERISTNYVFAAL